MPTQTRNRPATISVDFSNVGERRQGKAAAHVPAGDYLLEIVDYEIRSKQDDESRKRISWETKIVQPSAHAGKTIYHNTGLSPESLWTLRNLLEDCGIKVPKKLVDLPLAKMIGKRFGATLEDDDYNPEKLKSKVAATFAAAEFTETSAPEEETDDEEEATAAVTTSSDDEDDMEELDMDDI